MDYQDSYVAVPNCAYATFDNNENSGGSNCNESSQFTKTNC